MLKSRYKNGESHSANRLQWNCEAINTNIQILHQQAFIYNELDENTCNREGNNNKVVVNKVKKLQPSTRENPVKYFKWRRKNSVIFWNLQN